MTKIHDRAAEPAPVYAKRTHGHGGLAFFTFLALLTSLISLAASGLLAYRLLDWQQTMEAIGQPLRRAPAPEQSPVAPRPDASAPVIQPGQLVQAAIENKAQVELISVNRIQNPNTKLRDFVNIQFRVKRSAPQNQAINYNQGVIFPGETKARNPSTGETYEAVDRQRWATSNVAVSDLKSGAAADAYVWMQIPEGVEQIDILIPKTQVFKSVTIAN